MPAGWGVTGRQTRRRRASVWLKVAPAEVSAVAPEVSAGEAASVPAVTPVAAVAGKSVTTYEGLAALYAEQKGLTQAPALHPLQQAFIDEQAPHCGYCYNGMLIKGSELLAQTPRPTEAQIRAHMNGHLCRCGTYPRVMKAIQLASTRMAGGAQ